MGRIKKWISVRPRKAAAAGAGILVFMVVAGTGTWMLMKKADANITYRQTQAVRGELTVGVTEEGNITVGTTQQTFDLDLSAYTGTASTEFSWDNIFQGMGQESSSSGNTSRSLKVEEVLVSQGEQIRKGDPVARLTADSVDYIREQLNSDTQDALVIQKKTQTQYQLSSLEAAQNYETNTAYQVLADTEYHSAVQALNDAVLETQEQIEEKQEKQAEYQVKLNECQALLVTEREVLKNAEYVVNTTDATQDAYSWITVENAREEAAATAANLEDEEEELTNSIEQLQEELEELAQQLTGRQKAWEEGIIDAQAVLETRRLKGTNAQEYYDISVELSQFEADSAADEYEAVKARLNEFDSCIQDGQMLASHDGIVSRIDLQAGSTLATGTTLLVINDYDEVQVSVTVEEADLEYIKEEDKVNIYISSFPDIDFTGTVTVIGDSSYDSSSATTVYEVTVTVNGDTSELLEDMSAEVTFITRQTDTVLYVSNRAVLRENGKSYVRKQMEDGTVIKQEVTTGFSDGQNIVIMEGLSEGDTVLIESKVKNT